MIFMCRINEIEEKLRKEQQKMMFSLHTGDCLDKFEWVPEFKKVFEEKRRYTAVEVKRIKKNFKHCNVLLHTFGKYLELQKAA